jgi:hypothetical protein
VQNLGAIFVVIDQPEPTGPVPGEIAADGLVTAQFWLPLQAGGPALACYDAEPGAAGGRYPHVETQLAGWLGPQAAARSTAYLGDQLHPGALTAPEQGEFAYLIRLRVDPAVETEWNRWYNEEHIPFLAAVTGVLCARRFRSYQPDALGRNYLAMYHLTSPEIPKTEEWKHQSLTDWTLRMKPHHQPGKSLALFTRAH